MRRPPRILPLLGLACLLGAPSRTIAAEPEGHRWPLWPTELERLGAPLMDEGPEPAPESERRSALHALQPYATPLVEPIILRAIDDPSPQIRRDALQSCADRQMLSCIEAAERLWAEPLGDLSGRLYSLRLMLLDATPERINLVLGALRENAPLLRIEAARLLGVTALPAEHGPQVRAALVAKLADPDAEVRRAAARSLSLLGSREATLVLARMLEDPDPQLRRDAAEALGRIADPRALPALLRALDRGDEAYVVRALLDGLIRQPGVEVDRRLLELLDAPPPGLKGSGIAQALGSREAPSRELLDGLLLRLREPSLRPDLLKALLHMGDAALPAIQAALDRGVEPELAIELDRLIRARNLPTEPPSRPGERLPAADERQAWHERLGRGKPKQIEAAAALGELSPPWLLAAIAGALPATGDAIGDRPWLVALALTASKAPPREHRLWAAVLQRAQDPRRSVSDRCLAIAAAGNMPSSARAAFGDPLRALAADRRAAIRSCAAFALGRLDGAAPLLAALLDDPSPRVRSAAALALGQPRPKERKAIATHLAWLSIEDADGRVREAANLPRLAPSERPAPARLLIGPADPRAPGWLTVEAGGRRLRVPAQTTGTLAWALLSDPRLEPAAPSPLPGEGSDDEWIE